MVSLTFNAILFFDFFITLFENLIVIKTINLFFESKIRITAIYSIFLTILSYILNQFSIDLNIISIVLIVFVFLYTKIFLLGNIIKKIIAVIFTYISLMIINISIVLLADLLNVELSSYFLQYNYSYFLIISFQKLVFLMQYWFIKKHLSKDSIISNKTSIYLAVLLIISILLTEIILTTFITKTIISNKTFYFLIIIIVLICLLIFKIYQNVLLDYRKILDQQILLETTKQEERLLNILNNKIEEINRINHDFNNHQLILKNIQSSYEISYLKEYISQYEPYSYINTDNSVLNYLLNEKIHIAKQNNIDIKCIIEGSFIKTISNVDLCIIIGNLLDNSIEAAKHTEDGYIHLKIKQNEHTLIINIENNYKNIKIYNNNYKTLKKGTNHGFGLSNIKLICEKYNGSNYIQHENNVFIHSCILLTNNL